MRGWVTIFGALALWVVGRLAALEADWLRLSMDAVLALTVLVTALRFDRGDPPRWAWGCAAVSQALGTTLHFGQAGGFSDELMQYSPALMVALNVFWVAAIVVFVRNVASSGLAPPWTARHRLAVSGALVLALAGLALVINHELASIEGKDWQWTVEVSNFVSATADAAVFIGAVFLVRMVAPMAGGRVARPYFLICFSAAAFLVVDIIVASADARVYAALDTGSQIWVALADGALMAAALAQLELLREHA